MVGFYRRFLRVGAAMPSHLTITKNSCRVSATQSHQLHPCCHGCRGLVPSQATTACSYDHKLAMHAYPSQQLQG